MTTIQLTILTIISALTILHVIYINGRKKKIGKISISMTKKGRFIIKKIGLYGAKSLKKGGFENIDDCFNFIKERNL